MKAAPKAIGKKHNDDTGLSESAKLRTLEDGLCMIDRTLNARSEEGELSWMLALALETTNLHPAENIMRY